MADKILTNHLGVQLYLARETFERCIAEQAKLHVVHMLEDLFEQPDEVWQLEMVNPRHVWRYVKFYKEGILFGIVDIRQSDYLRVVDWYFMKHHANEPNAEVQANAIEAERSGELKFSKSRDSPFGEQDPVPIFLDALKTGQDPETALAAAHEAHQRWWAVDCTDREYSDAELMELLELRSFVLGGVAAVCVWNKEFEIADRIQPEFIYHQSIWRNERREAIELYLIHLIFQEQFERIESIFSDKGFKKEFLAYDDLFRSVMNPHYEFQSKQGPFLDVVNKVNQYCRQIGRKALF